jgi:sortase A
MFRRQRYLAIAAILLVGCSSSETARVSDSTAAHPATTSTQVVVAATTTAPTTTTAALVPPVAAAAPNPQPSGLPGPQPPPDPAANEAVVELGTIQIPRLGLDKPFYEGVTLATLNRGPGHWPGTALPGAVGNVVLGGHRTSKGRPFRHLEQLMPSDEVIFTTGAGQFVYRVTRTEIVTPESMWIVNQTEAYTATLFACNPVGSTKERIVVFLELGV